MSQWCLKATKYFGSKITKEDITDHKIVGSVLIPPRIIFKLQDEVWAEWESLPPTEPGIADKIASLRDHGFQVCIVTSRPLRSIIYVKQWLTKVGINYDEFCSLSPQQSKIVIKADALVDDAPEQIRDFIRVGRTGFLYKQPWNRSVKIPKAILVNGLSEILKHYKLISC